MKTLNYVDLTDLPLCDEMYDELKSGGDLNIDLSPNRPTILDNTDLDDLRYRQFFALFFDEIDRLKILNPDFKIMVHG